MLGYKKNIFNVGFLTVINIAATFILGVVISRELGPEGRGFIYLPITIATLFFPILSLGLKQSLSYYISKNEFDISTLRNKNAYSLMLIVLATTVAFTLIFVLFENDYRKYFFPLLIYSFFRVISDIYSFSFIVNRKTYYITLLNALRTIFDLLIITTLLYKFKSYSQYILYILAFTAILMFVVQCYFYKKQHIYIGVVNKNYVKNNITNNIIFKDLISKGMQFSIPLFLIGLNISSDLMVLSYFKGSYEVGIYQTAVTIANLIWVIPNFLSLVTFSFAINTNKNSDLNKLLFSSVKVIVISSLISILLYFTSDYFMVSLYGIAFIDSAAIFKILLPGYLLMLAYKLTYPIVASKGYTKQTSYIFFISFIINLILNLLLIPSFGPLGAAYSTLVSYVFCSICFIFFAYKVLK